MADHTYQQLVHRQFSHFENLAHELHTDQQLFLQPPPSCLSDAVRTALRQSKPCRSPDHPDLLCDYKYYTGLHLPNDTRALLVVDVLYALVDGQATVVGGWTANHVEALGHVTRPQALVHAVQQLRLQVQQQQQTLQEMQPTINAIATNMGNQVLRSQGPVVLGSPAGTPGTGKGSAVR